MAIVIVAGALTILCALAVLVGWSVIFARYYLVAKQTQAVELGAGYWWMLVLGCVFLTAVVTVLVVFVVSNIRKTLLMSQQDVFINSVTHELRSPLASLMLAIDTLQQRELSGDLRARFLDTMRLDVDRLFALIERVLKTARLEHGPFDVKPRRIDLQAVASRCADAACRRYQWERDYVTVSAEGETAIESDPDAVETVISNLIDNAVKYSRKSSPVDVHLQPSAGMVKVAVQDHGVGMSRRQIKRVFRRFYRAPLTGERAIPGTGLGLYLVASLVHKLGGTYGAASAGQGQGSTFWVRLPLRSVS